MFRAVSDQLFGSDEYHAQLRQATCDYLDRNEAYFKDFISDEFIGMESYTERMRKDGVWAGDIEL